MQNQNPKPTDWYSEKAKSVLNKLFPPVGRTQDPSIVEEQEKIVRKAADYDQLEPSAGWGHVLENMMNLVNTEIMLATTNPMNPKQQTLHVIRWNAMRELLDGALADIKDTRKERDRIVEGRNADRD